MLVAALVAGTACGDDEGAGPTTPPPTEPTTTTTDPFAIPDEIDEPYVQQVLDHLYSIEGDALRRAVEVGVDDEVLALIEAANTPDEARIVSDAFRDAEANEFEGIRRPPGRFHITVEELGTTVADCIWVQILRDGSEVSTTASTEGVTLYVQLEPGEVSATNPTGWRISTTRTTGPDGVIPEDRCA